MQYLHKTNHCKDTNAMLNWDSKPWYFLQKSNFFSVMKFWYERSRYFLLPKQSNTFSWVGALQPIAFLVMSHHYSHSYPWCQDVQKCGYQGPHHLIWTSSIFNAYLYINYQVGLCGCLKVTSKLPWILGNGTLKVRRGRGPFASS